MSGAITTGAKCHAFAMASWHVFKQNWLAAFVCHRVGGFSVYREGLDRKALDTAIGIVATAERPLIIFPEGGISAANDRLMSLMEGTSFVARAAARSVPKLIRSRKLSFILSLFGTNIVPIRRHA